MTEFSILQSVYYKDNPDFLAQSLQSIANNTIQPKNIVLVKDGLLSNALENVIAEWEKNLPITVVGYEQNQGLAYALNYGLDFVKTEIVARMDSDDICFPDRFEKQINFMKSHPEIALSSTYINEFNNDENVVVSIRKVPIGYDEIRQYLKKRNAFNHMSVIFRKSAILDAGGYQRVPYFEDYDLWIRVIQKGYKAENLPESLIKARIGNDMIGRRHGLSYAKHEIFFLKRQLKSHFISKAEYIKLVLLRVPVRLLPKSALEKVYKLLRG